MGKETECRYEVKYIPKNLEILDVLLISQAYLVAKELDELRVRKSVSLFTRIDELLSRFNPGDELLQARNRIKVLEEALELACLDLPGCLGPDDTDFMRSHYIHLAKKELGMLDGQELL